MIKRPPINTLDSVCASAELNEVKEENERALCLNAGITPQEIRMLFEGERRKDSCDELRRLVWSESMRLAKKTLVLNEEQGS